MMKNNVDNLRAGAGRLEADYSMKSAQPEPPASNPSVAPLGGSQQVVPARSSQPAIGPGLESLHDLFVGQVK